MTSHPHSDKHHLLLTRILLIFVVMTTVLVVAECAGSIQDVNSAGIPNQKSMIPSENKNIIFNITHPLEDDVIYYDVVPAYLSVDGTIFGSNDIRNITVTYGNESAECGKKHDTYFDVSCNFLINDNIKNITIKVVDSQNHVTSEKRTFSTHAGPPPPGTIYVYGNVVDINGNPVSDAVLTFETETKDKRLVSVNTTTDRNGKYSMKKANGFQQKITVKKAGYQTIVQEVRFEPYGHDIDFTLFPQKSSASGFGFVVAAFAIITTFLITHIRKERR